MDLESGGATGTPPPIPPCCCDPCDSLVDAGAIGSFAFFFFFFLFFFFFEELSFPSFSLY